MLVKLQTRADASGGDAERGDPSALLRHWVGWDAQGRAGQEPLSSLIRIIPKAPSVLSLPPALAPFLLPSRPASSLQVFSI